MLLFCSNWMYFKADRARQKKEPTRLVEQQRLLLLLASPLSAAPFDFIKPLLFSRFRKQLWNQPNRSENMMICAKVQLTALCLWIVFSVGKTDSTPESHHAQKTYAAQARIQRRHLGFSTLLHQAKNKILPVIEGSSEYLHEQCLDKCTESLLFYGAAGQLLTFSHIYFHL